MQIEYNDYSSIDKFDTISWFILKQIKCYLWQWQARYHSAHCPINKLQRVLNAMAKVIYGGNKGDRITPFIQDKLHWLHIPETIIYCLLTCTATHKQVSQYIAAFCQLEASVASTSSLWSISARFLLLPRAWMKFGDSSFSITGPRAWNKPTTGKAPDWLNHDVQRKAKNTSV